MQWICPFLGILLIEAMDKNDFAGTFPGQVQLVPEGGVAFIPDPLPPVLHLGHDIQNANEAALLALGELRAVIPSLPNPRLITNPFLRREAILSSRIEGSQVELEQLYLFEVESAKQPPSDQESDETLDAREVFNYIKALEYGLQQTGELPICNRLLKEVHKRLMLGVRGKHKMPGEFRNMQNFIGRDNRIVDARFVPPPVEHVEHCMCDLEKFVNNVANDNLPILVRTALVHYQFEAIHPFADGNGRLGRLLVSLLLRERGILPEPPLYLSAYFERHRDQYVTHLWEISCRGAWTDWILFFLEGIQHEAVDAGRRARKILELREQYRKALQKKGSAALLTLVDALFDTPWITVREATTLLNMTYNGAKNNIDKLQKEGILAKGPRLGRNRIFIAKNILNLLESNDDI